MALEFQVLGPGDIDEVYSFAEKRLRGEIEDERERAFASWSVKWRREALENYLRLGWSFVARENGETAGFFLGQALLFFRGQTQTLWIEHLEAKDQASREALFDVAVRVAREKHLQRLLAAESFGVELSRWGAKAIEDRIIEVKTTKG